MTDVFTIHYLKMTSNLTALFPTLIINSREDFNSYAIPTCNLTYMRKYFNRFMIIRCPGDAVIAVP